MVWLLAVMAGCGPKELAVQRLDTDTLSFGTCPEGLPHGEGAECALVDVPLDWSNPDGRRIVVFVRRVRAVPDQVSPDQLWALDGGPGFAGDVFMDPAFREVVRPTGYDLIVPTHRGTVYGTGLQCPEQQAPTSPGGGQVTPEESASCVDALQATWGEDLARFDSRQAARDVLHLIDRLPTPGRRVVYGGSYGSVWGQRVLQLDPPLSGMWLDSIVDLEGSLERADEHANEAGLALLERCASAPACAQQFPAGVSDAAHALATALPGKVCGVPGPQLQALMYRWLSNHPAEMALVAPALRRLTRCSDADAEALAQAVSHLESRAAAGPRLNYNPLLNRLVIHRELYRHRDLDAADAPGLIFTSSANRPVAEALDAYPRSLVAPPWADVPEVHVPLVLWQGGLDPLDPPVWARRTAERWAASPVTLFELPDAGHSVVRYARTADGRSCATEMLAAFLADPAAPLASDCLAEVPAVDVAATTAAVRDAASTWFGTSDPWGVPKPDPTR